jgi:hypothetical protein
MPERFELIFNREGSVGVWHACLACRSSDLLSSRSACRSGCHSQTPVPSSPAALIHLKVFRYRNLRSYFPDRCADRGSSTTSVTRRRGVPSHTAAMVSTHCVDYAIRSYRPIWCQLVQQQLSRERESRRLPCAIDYASSERAAGAKPE